MSGASPLITIFAAPKPFDGETAALQDRAIQSWTMLAPECEVLLMGDDAGVRERAESFGVRHVEMVDRNEWGTPRVDSLFAGAEVNGCGQLLCYVNADIVLGPDFLSTVKSVSFSRFLMVGRRTNLDPTHHPDGTDAASVEEIRSRAHQSGVLGAPDQIDYFVYSRGLWPHIPPFALGRLMFDNWLIYAARAARAPVLDATESVLAVHQNHDYLHVAAGNAAEGYAAIQAGPEAARNLELAGGLERAFTVSDATGCLRGGQVRRPRLTGDGLYRTFEVAAVLHPRLSGACAVGLRIAEFVLRVSYRPRHGMTRFANREAPRREVG